MVTLDRLMAQAPQGGSAAMADALSRVLPSYETALREAAMPARISRALFLCHTWGRKGEVEVLVADDGRPQQAERLVVKAPVGLRALSPADQTWLAADVAHTGLTRLARSLRWDPEDAAHILHAAHAQTVAGLPPRETELRVHAGGRGSHAPDQPHELVFVGGGPASTPRVQAYDRAADRLLGCLGHAQWQEWWSHSPVPLGRVYVWHTGTKAQVQVTVSGSVEASIARPPATINPTNPQGQALEDVTRLIERLRQRLELPDPPELPQEETA